MKTIIRKSLIFISILTFVLITSAYTIKQPLLVVEEKANQVIKEMDFNGDYDWEVEPNLKTSSEDFITYQTLRNSYIIPIKNSTETIANMLSAVNEKFIRFDTAEELYDFSRDVSFIEQFTTFDTQTQRFVLNQNINQDLVTALMSLNYVLGQDIDYAVMESRSFDPIGYDFTYKGVTYTNHFTGTFNGQGFEIANLYVSGYQRINLTDATGEPFDVPLSVYYAMFNLVSQNPNASNPSETGVIRNLGLINPNLEILQLNDDLDKLANVAGENNGTIDHVYVIDNRQSVTEAGIRYRVGNTPIIFSAAGIVHTNNGNLSNVYFSSKVVVNGNFINKFVLEPIAYENNGSLANAVYDSTVYLINVTVGSSVFTINSPTIGVGESTSLMKSTSSSLSSGEWYFYPLDGYPILQGMALSGGYYLIENARDLAFFPELIEFNTLSYNEANFKLTNDIDMSILAPGIYRTPSVTFSGEFLGTNDSAQDQSDHYYIYNLNQTEYLAINSKIYAGLFSVLGSGSLVKDLNLTQSSISIDQTGVFYSYDVFVGGIAGEMIAGRIENVYVDVDIDLGEDAIGSIRLGGVVGQASGVIERVTNNGTINVNNHTYTTSTVPVDGRHYIGGIVGRTAVAKLQLIEVANRGDIFSYDTDSSITLASGTQFYIYTGGVIGFVNHSTFIKHELSDVTNSGDLTIYSMSQPTNGTGRQYLGGVVGLISGSAPVLEQDNQIKFASFVNQGNLNYTYSSGAIQVYASGIASAQMTQSYELALLKNEGGLNVNLSGSSPADFNYASIVYDLGSVNFTLTRVYNYVNHTYNSNLYSSTYGMVTSVNNNHISLRFSANYGDVNFIGSSQITLNKELKVFAITGQNNVDYINVHNYGNINVVNVNTGVYYLYIAGFSPTLSNDKVIKNSLNAGNITFADISGTGLIFVGGMVNTNLSGDLQNFAIGANQPIATMGILNSLNSGNITTTYSPTQFGIDGLNNSFVGGLVTMNSGSIQDSANLGNIALVNTNSSGSATFFPSTSSAYEGGLVSSYTGGISAGGVAGIVLSERSRIYDSSNNGDVLVKTNRFSRAGGVLGVSLYRESQGGNITSGLGLENNIQNSVLSNGLNFGNVSAIASFYQLYATGSVTGGNGNPGLIAGVQADPFVFQSASRTLPYTYADTAGSGERLPVYASAGGVIGYGLSVMRNMLNHGTISSTDVAGGVVGATFVLGGADGPSTVVNISTAVNYGDIKAISTASFAAISNNNNNFIIDVIEGYYLPDGDSFIFPSGYNREGPRSKRGFGGIFGRLQRGNLGTMTSIGGAFDFIVNANPNVDLIGRIDQVNDFGNTVTAYVFYDAIYYSARLNDTTQAVFTGFQYYSGTVTNVVYTGRSGRLGSWWSGYYYDHYFNVTVDVDTVNLQQGTRSTFEYNVPSQGTTTNQVTVRSTSTAQPANPSNVGDDSGPVSYFRARPVNWITENPSDPNITSMDDQYMYDPDFEMRTNTNLTEYIYYAEAELLADRFQASGENPRPNGMYVLATSAGQTFGSVLPRNIDREEIGIIDEALNPNINIDYNDVDDYRLNLDVSIIDSYNKLRQTVYSDQANLINDPLNQDFRLEEVGGSLTTLEPYDIDYDSRIIYVAISMEAFDPFQSTASFVVTDAFTSSDALIGIWRSASGLTTNQLQEALYLERYTRIATGANTQAVLTVNLPDYNIGEEDVMPQLLGYFSVYSEAFYMDPENDTFEFDNDYYYNDYEVQILFLPNFNEAGQTTGIDNVSFNGGSNINVTTASSIDIRTIGDVSYDGSLTLNFVDNNFVLSPGYDFKNLFKLYYHDDSLVPLDYYTVSSVPVDGSWNYSITFEFSEALRSGDYYLEYSYFPTSSKHRVDFDKSASPNNFLIDFSYVTENGSVPGTITNDFDSEIDINEVINNFTIGFQANSVSYLSDTYTIGFMTQLMISPFAEVDSVTKTGERFESGYKVHELTYTILSEIGVPNVYTHEIYERTTNIAQVEKNTNVVSIDNVFAERANAVTNFRVDLGLARAINSGFYGTPQDVFDIEIVDELGNAKPYQGISWTFGVLLNIQMTIDTEPGDYYFRIRYYRNASDFIEFETVDENYLKITKLQGTDAYLSDIRFSQFANETNYPGLSVFDSLGNLLTQYNPQAYFNGFDYDGARIAGERYFRIDGQVSNVPLDDYEPIFTGFTPIGASVERRDWNGSEWVWTSDLAANFTVDPQTGIEPAPDQDKVTIRYRVVPEDGNENNIIYYDISVTDITFNVTFIFDIYYCANGIGGACVLAKDSQDFNQQLVIINVQNLDTNGVKGLAGDNPNDYPTFSTVNGLINKSIQLFYTNSGIGYNYRFARNLSFFYNFSVDLPLDELLNDIYGYEIEFEIGLDTYFLNDANNYVPGLQGKYFYIQDSINLRTRRFNIYIYPLDNPSTDKPYGLFDFIRTWRFNDET